MWNKFSTLLLCLLFAFGCFAQTNLPTYSVQTLAGSAPMGDGSAASAAVLRFPSAIAFDSNGVLYIADQGDSSIRTVNSTGIINTLAGTGISGFSGDGGPANAAQLGGTISGLAFDAAGNLYISDSANHRVREVTKDGNINTVVCFNNLPAALSASFWPNGLAFDSKGNLYIADDHNSDVYLMTPDGTVSVFAGTGKAGNSGDEGPAIAASLVEPFGVFVDATGAVYITDIASSRIRKVTPEGTIHAFAGTGQAGFSGDGGPAAQAQLVQPMHLAGDKAGNIYVSDHSLANRNIRRIAADGTISTVAGGLNPNGMMGGDGGPADVAMIQQANGVALSPAGNLYFSDSDSAVRMVSQGMISTVVGYRHFAGENYLASQALLAMPNGVAVDQLGNVFVADANNFRLRQIIIPGPGPDQIITTDPGSDGNDGSDGGDGSDGSGQGPVTPDVATTQSLNTIATIAGTGQCGTTGDGGPAVMASMTRPLSLAADKAQNLYLGFNGLVRRITPGGMITTITGAGTLSADGIPAAYSKVGKITGIAVDASGVIYLSDSDYNVIRKITPDGLIRTIAGTGVAGDFGDGSAAITAQLNGPTNLALDSIGNLYFADTRNNRVRVIRIDGTMATFAGTGKVGEAGDGGPAIAAQLATPSGIAVDKAGTVYISDFASGLLRAVTTDGVIHTIAGAGADPANAGFAGDGGVALNAQFNGVQSLTVDQAGRVYVIDQLNERVRMLTPMSH